MVLGILQARLSSSRLPGKVMKLLHGEPMLARQIERLQVCRQIDKLVVATSDQAEDEKIVNLCEKLAVETYRGDLEDVLDRFYKCALIYSPDIIVRLTADCPLADPYLIDRVINHFIANNLDYASNTLTPTYPDGLDVEVVKFQVLKMAWQEAKKKSDREHVTSFIWSQPERFIVDCVLNDTDLSQMRWTVDEPADYEFVTRVYDALYQEGELFTTEDILKLIDNDPAIGMINSSIMRNEGFQKSLAVESVGESNIMGNKGKA